MFIPSICSAHIFWNFAVFNHTQRWFPQNPIGQCKFRTEFATQVMFGSKIAECFVCECRTTGRVAVHLIWWVENSVGDTMVIHHGSLLGFTPKKNNMAMWLTVHWSIWTKLYTIYIYIIRFIRFVEREKWHRNQPGLTFRWWKITIWLSGDRCPVDFQGAKVMTNKVSRISDQTKPQVSRWKSATLKEQQKYTKIWKFGSRIRSKIGPRVLKKIQNTQSRPSNGLRLFFLAKWQLIPAAG